MDEAGTVGRLTVALAAALTLSSSEPARSHTGSFVYPIYELPTSALPDLHDQTLEDWEEALPNASLTHSDFAYNGGLAGSIDPQNLAWRVFLAWHHASQRIFMAVERLDDDYWPRAEGGLEPTFLKLDGDHSGGQFGGFSWDLPEDELKRLESAQAQSYTMSSEPPFPDAEALIRGGGWANDWVTRPPWADAGGFEYGQAPNLSAVEVAVTPWDDLHWQGPELSTRSSLEPGRIIGFLVEIWDVDRDDRAIEMFVLARPVLENQPIEGSNGTGVTSSFAQNFVDGELVPCYSGDCRLATPSAVLSDSWGRIKAGLR